MKRSLQEVVELVVFGLVALLVGTALLWVFGWVLSLGGALFKALAGLLWLLLRFIVPIAIVAGLVYFLVKALQGRSSEAAVSTAGAGSSASSGPGGSASGASGSPSSPAPVAPPAQAAGSYAAPASSTADPVVHDPVITDPAAPSTDLPDSDVGTPGVPGGVAESVPPSTVDTGTAEPESGSVSGPTDDLAVDDAATQDAADAADALRDAEPFDDAPGTDEDEA